MGAVTSLLHSARDPTIGAVVLDSPFSNLKKLVHELAARNSGVPKFLIKAAYLLIRKTIQSQVKFDIDDISPIDIADQCQMPALFAHGKHDDFINLEHT